jgi:hypothetical protein
LRSGKAPDLDVARFNVGILNLEPICVLVLCTDQTPKNSVHSASCRSDTGIRCTKADQGNLPEALKTFRDGLGIRERLAQSDPSNAGWQFDVIVSYWKLAANGDDAARRFAFIVAALRKLKAENRLTPAQQRRLPEAEAQLAKTR